MSFDKFCYENLSSRHLSKLKKNFEKNSKKPNRNASKEHAIKEGSLSGIVHAAHGRLVTLEVDEERTVECFLRGTFKERLVIGDRVLWTPADEKNGVVHALVERKNILKRKNPMGEPKPFAANVDIMVIVSSVNPPLREGLIDRYLVEAESQGLESVLLLNKVDLPSADEFRNRISIYRDIGYKVFYVSTVEDDTFSELALSLAGKVSIFVGHSGVGKSSIINTLLPSANLRVSEIHEQSGQGRHTTSSSRMLTLDNGAKIIDSPGVRTFGLSSSLPEKVYPYFREFTKFYDKCRFETCTHISEADCAVREAVKNGSIHKIRYQNYLKIIEKSSETA